MQHLSHTAVSLAGCVQYPVAQPRVRSGRDRSVPPSTGYCNIGNGEADCCCASFIIMPHGDNAKRQMKRPAPILVAETSVAHESSFFPFNPLARAQFAFISNRMASKTPKKRDIVKPQRAGKLGEVRFDLGRLNFRQNICAFQPPRMRIVST